MNKLDIERKALELRSRLGISGIFHEDILRNRLEENGYFLFYNPFGAENFSGASYSEKNVKVAIINSSRPLGAQNFVLAHELGHIELHKSFNAIDSDGEDREKEEEANSFASYFLMPRDDVFSALSTDRGLTWTVFNVMELSQKFRVSYEAAYNRAHEIFGSKIVQKRLSEGICETETADVFGFGRELYLPTEERYMSSRLYVEKVVNAYRTEKISMGKLLALSDDIGLDGYEILDRIRDENVRRR